MVIIITGGASGIGRATAELFAEHGARVYVLDIKKIAGTDVPKNISFIKCDVANFKQLQVAVRKIHSQEKKIDALFTNAGIHLQATIENTSLKDLDKIINVNLKGIFYALQAVLPIMRKQKSGKVVLMGSDQTLVGKRENAIYGATKAAIGQLAKSTALDYAPYNINVNCVCPGATLTPLVVDAIKKRAKMGRMSFQKMHDLMAQDRPIGRFGESEEIAELVFFLCSDKAKFITGSLISIDGGYVCQ